MCSAAERSAGQAVGVALAVALLIGASGALSARQRDTSPQTFHGLPLIEVRAPESKSLALVMSGDGNWASFIRGLADSLVAHGVSVVGLESRTYLRRSKTPGVVAADMEAVLRHYVDVWSSTDVLVVGYSRGADFAPFVVDRLDRDVRDRVRGVVLLSPSRMASFEFHWTDLIGYTPRPSDLPLLPEVEALAPTTVICVCGRDDPDALCPLLTPATAEVHVLPSGHRLEDPSDVMEILTPLVDRVARRHGTRVLSPFTLSASRSRPTA